MLVSIRIIGSGFQQLTMSKKPKPAHEAEKPAPLVKESVAFQSNFQRRFTGISAAADCVR